VSFLTLQRSGEESLANKTKTEKKLNIGKSKEKINDHIGTML
jgi:hypothetical protein